MQFKFIKCFEQALVYVRIHGEVVQVRGQKVPGLRSSMKQIGMFPRGDGLYFAFRHWRFIAFPRRRAEAAF